jgi:hypothetical protein
VAVHGDVEMRQLDAGSIFVFGFVL